MPECWTTLVMTILTVHPAHGTTVFSPGLSGGPEGTIPDLQKILNTYFGVNHEDIYIRDDLGDNGNTPSTGAISSSPDISVRNSSTSISTYTADRNRTDNEPITGSSAFIYVRVFNRGNVSANNIKVSLYYSL